MSPISEPVQTARPEHRHDLTLHARATLRVSASGENGLTSTSQCTMAPGLGRAVINLRPVKNCIARIA